MNVCFLINQVAPGGAPTLLLDIVKQTTDPQVTYTVCVIEGDRSLVDEFEEAGATVVDFDASFKFDPRAIWRMARFFRTNDFDVLHAHLPYSQTLGRLLGSLGGCRTIVSTQHNVPENYHPITRTLERVTRPIDTKTVAVSEGVERAFTGDSARYEGGQDRRWCTIYNGIDVESFSRKVDQADPEMVRDRWDVSADLVYLNISRYVDAKSQIDLITAMDEVAHKDVHLFIVGWGELEQQLKQEVFDRELTDLVTVTGKVPTVHEYYALADVFVSSSVFEGMPIAHLEAMAAGLPVVATDIPGVNEVVGEGENGLLVPPERPKKLARAMLDVRASESRQQWGETSLRRVHEQFSIDQTVQTHLTLYRELLDE